MSRRTGTERLEARKARLERHAAETDPKVVLNAAARFLELRSRSIQEVRRHLADAKYPAELIEGALARLLELGVLNDRAFASAWVESRDRARPRGEGALRRELNLKGIDAEIVAAVLAERDQAPGGDAGAEGDEFSGPSADVLAAERLLSKKRSTLARIDDPRSRRGRAYALLARNGFDPEVCREVSARLTSLEIDADD